MKKTKKETIRLPNILIDTTITVDDVNEIINECNDQLLTYCKMILRINSTEIEDLMSDKKEFNYDVFEKEILSHSELGMRILKLNDEGGTYSELLKLISDHLIYFYMRIAIEVNKENYEAAAVIVEAVDIELDYVLTFLFSLNRKVRADVTMIKERMKKVYLP